MDRSASKNHRPGLVARRQRHSISTAIFPSGPVMEEPWEVFGSLAERGEELAGCGLPPESSHAESESTVSPLPITSGSMQVMSYPPTKAVTLPGGSSGVGVGRGGRGRRVRS